MLQDYYDEVIQETATLRQEAVDALISSPSGSHDTYAGRIKAIDDVISLMEEVLIRYRADEADVEGRGPTRAKVTFRNAAAGLKGTPIARYARGRA